MYKWDELHRMKCTKYYLLYKDTRQSTGKILAQCTSILFSYTKRACFYSFFSPL